MLKFVSRKNVSVEVNMKDLKSKISFLMKIIIPLISLGGLVLAFFGAEADGYSHWAKRLLYFTTQSNVWIAFTMAAILLIPLIPEAKRAPATRVLYLLKYLFTVSITITGIVFCVVLAPFADKGYRPWSISSILTHVLTPILSIVDYVIDRPPFEIGRKEKLYTTIPPFLYLAFASILSVLKIDFGRGDPFPYFFLNYYSPAGVFGFSDQPPFVLGSFYWIVIFLLIVLGIASLLARIGRKKKH